MTGVKKVRELGKDRERMRDPDRHSTQEQIKLKALVKNESKQAAGFCLASGRSPPDGPVLQSARPRGRPRPPRSFEICQDCSARRPRPRRLAAPRPEGGREVRGGRRGLRHTYNVNAKAGPVTRPSQGKRRGKGGRLPTISR